MARFIGLVMLIFTPLSIFGQNKDLLYRNGTISGVVNENALKPTWSNVQNAPVFDYVANRIWFGNGTTQTTSANLTFANNQLVVGGDLSLNSLYLGYGASSWTNVFLGFLPPSVSTGYNNTALSGRANPALSSLTTGYYNVAIGNLALYKCTTGLQNMAIGGAALLETIGGSQNTAVGVSALQYNVSGSQNIGIGFSSLISTTGDNNVGVGATTLYNNTSGSNNVAIGRGAATNITTGSNNITIGANMAAVNATGSNQLNIGNWIYGDNGNIGIGTTANSNYRLDLAAVANPLRLNGLQTNNSTTALLVHSGGVVQTRDLSTLPTSSWDATLAVNNTTTRSFSTTGTVITSAVQLGSNSNFWILQNASENRVDSWNGQPFVIRQDATEKARFTNTGLGINNTPTYPLDVTGDMRTTGKLRLGTGSGGNHSTIEKVGLTTVYNNLGAGHIFQAYGVELAKFDGGMTLNNAATLTFRNDASANISTMTNGDLSYQPSNSTLYVRTSGKRETIKKGVNFRQNVPVTNTNIDCSQNSVSVVTSDSTFTMLLTNANCPNSVDVYIILPSNPENDAILRYVAKGTFSEVEFAVAGGTSQSITTAVAWGNPAAWSEWEARFYSTSQGSQGGEWTITKIR